MAELTHPHKAEVQLLREVILGASAEIAEGIKWKSPSFRTHEYFATVNLREKKGVGVILHLGAKVRELASGGLAIADPAKLLDWLAADRACVRFGNREEIDAARPAFQELIREWIRHV